jgi:hypothetical protein
LKVATVVKLSQSSSETSSTKLNADGQGTSCVTCALEIGKFSTWVQKPRKLSALVKGLAPAGQSFSTMNPL